MHRPADAASTQLTSYTEYIFGEPYPLGTVALILLPLVYHVMELTAFLLLWKYARRGLARDISPHTLVALAVCPTIATVVDVSYWYIWQSVIQDSVELTIGWWILVLAPAAVAVAAWGCSRTVWLNGGADAEDHLLGPSYPAWVRWSCVYVAAAVSSLVVTSTVCYLTQTEMFSAKDFALVATFMNFLHGFALLPQLVLSRRRGFVAPGALKFLLIIGIKHLMEFAIDVRTSSFVSVGKPDMTHRDAGCLLGDLLSALVLLDFLYLWSLTACKVGMKRGIDAGLELQVV